MKGSYQNKNINTAIWALKKIKSINLDENKTLKGIMNVIRNTKLIGRWQIVKENPTIIFDVAHNINSLEIIFGQLKKIVVLLGKKFVIILIIVCVKLLRLLVMEDVLILYIHKMLCIPVMLHKL